MLLLPLNLNLGLREWHYLLRIQLLSDFLCCLHLVIVKHSLPKKTNLRFLRFGLFGHKLSYHSEFSRILGNFRIFTTIKFLLSYRPYNSPDLFKPNPLELLYLYKVLFLFPFLFFHSDYFFYILHNDTFKDSLAMKNYFEYLQEQQGV